VGVLYGFDGVGGWGDCERFWEEFLSTFCGDKICVVFCDEIVDDDDDDGWRRITCGTNDLGIVFETVLVNDEFDVIIVGLES